MQFHETMQTQRVIEMALVPGRTEYVKLESGVVLECQPNWEDWHRAKSSPEPLSWEAVGDIRLLAFPVPPEGFEHDETWDVKKHQDEAYWVIVQEEDIPAITEATYRKLREGMQ